MDGLSLPKTLDQYHHPHPLVVDAVHLLRHCLRHYPHRLALILDRKFE